MGEYEVRADNVWEITYQAYLAEALATPKDGMSGLHSSIIVGRCMDLADEAEHIYRERYGQAREVNVVTIGAPTHGADD